MTDEKKRGTIEFRQFAHSLPVGFPTRFAEEELEKLQSSDMSIEKEVELEKNYLGRLLKYKGDISHIKCK